MVGMYKIDLGSISWIWKIGVLGKGGAIAECVFFFAGLVSIRRLITDGWYHFSG